jgi:hypothetical protein
MIAPMLASSTERSTPSSKQRIVSIASMNSIRSCNSIRPAVPSAGRVPSAEPKCSRMPSQRPAFWPLT